MNSELDLTPSFLYKYRKIEKPESLKYDFQIKALFESYAILSTRNSFNDLFDSKIILVPPLRNEIRSLVKDKLINSDKKLLSNTCKKLLDDSNSLINTMLDNYYFYCLSANVRSNVMWSHYADNHKGFCIEFKYQGMMAEKVYYEKEVPKIRQIDFFTSDDSRNVFAKEIGRALRVKLDEWQYEAEYRFHASNNVKFIPILDKDGRATATQTLKYDPSSVESIIFGYRMETEIRDFIIKNIPFKTKFKEVIKLESTLDIREIRQIKKLN